jgi:hypothetical protein
MREKRCGGRTTWVLDGLGVTLGGGLMVLRERGWVSWDVRQVLSRFVSGLLLSGLLLLLLFLLLLGLLGHVGFLV